MAFDQILIIEDDPEMTEVLRQGFEQEGLAVHAEADGSKGLGAARERRFQAIVLDVMVPGQDGFGIAQDLRADGNRTPILMLTARDSVTDIVHGLDCGVDDYLTKPFSFLELAARVRALIRRSSPPSGRLEVGDLALDPTTHQVLRRGLNVHLTRTEFQLLEVLMRRAGETVRRRDLIRGVWGANTSVEENTLDVSISSLRARIESPGLPRVIHTIRGFGYRLEVRP